MNKILILLLMLSTLTSAGQIEIYNLSLTDSTKNILYRGIENHLKIIGHFDYTGLKITSTSSNVFIDTLNKSEVTVRLNKRFDYDTIKLFLNDTIIVSKIFSCKLIPDFKVQYGETEDTVLTKNEVLCTPYLKLFLPNCYYKHDFRIVQFDVSYLLFNPKENTLIKNRDENHKITCSKVDKYTEEYKVVQLIDSVYIFNPDDSTFDIKKEKSKSTCVNGSSLTKLHQKIIMEMRQGDKICIKDIKINCPYCSAINVGSLTIIIK